MNLPSLHPRDVKRWIAELPKMHVGKTGHALSLFLETLKARDIPPRRRIAILEEVREPLLFVTDTLKRHYVPIGLPIPPKAQRIVELACRMHRKMALAYALAAQALLPRPPFWHRGLLALALQRALNHMERCQLAYYQTYAPLPKGLWERIHQLYFHAEKGQVGEKPVEDPHLAVETHITPEDAYKHALLLSLADPYRLHLLDIEKVNQALEVWSKEASLLYLNNHRSPKGFLVDLHSDTGPFPFLGKGPLPPNIRFLDTGPLVQKLAQMAEQGSFSLTTRQGEDIVFSDHLMRTLIARWSIVQERKHPRFPKDTPLTILVGLISIHRSLEGPLEEETPSTEIDLSLTPFAPLQPEPTSAHIPKRFQGRLQDENAWGCRIRWENPSHLDLHVGDLIAIQDGAFKIGIIRGIKGNDHLEMGVQYLADHVEPVWVKREGEEDAQAKPALWSPPLSQLITLPLYSRGETLEVRFPQGTFKARLERLLEKDYGLALFSIKLVASASKEKGAASNTGDEDIWSQLF